MKKKCLSLLLAAAGVVAAAAGPVPAMTADIDTEAATPLGRVIDYVRNSPAAQVLNERNEQMPSENNTLSTLSETLVALPYKKKNEMKAVDDLIKSFKKAYAEGAEQKLAGIISRPALGSNRVSETIEVSYPGTPLTCGGKGHGYAFLRKPEKKDFWNKNRTVEGAEWWLEAKEKRVCFRLIRVHGPLLKKTATPSMPPVTVREPGDEMIKNLETLGKFYKTTNDDGMKRAVIATINQYFNLALMNPGTQDNTAYRKRLFTAMGQLPGYSVELVSSNGSHGTRTQRISFDELARRYDKLNIFAIGGLDSSDVACKKYGDQSRNGILSIVLND